MNYTTLVKKFNTREKKVEPFSGLKLFHFHRYESRKIGPGGMVVVNLGSGSGAKRKASSKPLIRGINTANKTHIVMSAYDGVKTKEWKGMIDGCGSFLKFRTIFISFQL